MSTQQMHASLLPRLSLPHEGGWSILELCGGERPRRIVVTHPDPRQQALAQTLVEAWSHGAFGAHARVMRTGTSESIDSVTDAMLFHIAKSPDQLRVLRELRIGSVLIVRMDSEGHAIGSVTFVGPRWGHAFDGRDRVLAEDLAMGAALAIISADGAEATTGR